jgi:hypothetical protein
MAKVERQMEGRANSAHLLERSGEAVITEKTPWGSRSFYRPMTKIAQRILTNFCTKKV